MNVSVIIPVYNAAPFVANAVESALAHQEVKEVLLIEDGSPDDSLAVCEQLVQKDNRVKLVRHEGGVNKGAGASRNLGIANATQEFICFLDADDRMTSRRFTVEKEVFLENPEADGVYGATGAQYYDEIGKAAWNDKGYDEAHLDRINKPVPVKKLFDYLIGYKNANGYAGHFTIDAFTLKRERLMQHEIRFADELRLHQDSVFIWKCAYYLNLYPGDLENPVAIRGVHSNNRFIHHKNINESRAGFFSVLMNWSEESNLDQAYKTYFKSNFTYFNLAKRNCLISFPGMFFYSLTNKQFRKLFTNHLLIRLLRFLKK